MTRARLSVALCVVWHLLCMSSDQGGATPDDDTLLIQIQTTMDHRSSGGDVIMSEHVAAELLQMFTNFPDIKKKIARLDPVHEICNQMNKWIRPLTSWLNITLDESSKSMDKILHNSLLMEEAILRILRNKTVSVDKQLRMAEVLFDIGLLPGGTVEKKLMRALAPMNLGGALHLDRYKVSAPAVSGNQSFYELLMKGLVQKMRAGFKEGDRRARENATETIKQLNAQMESGMAQTGLLGKAIGASLANFTGTLSKDMETVMPAECSSVYVKPIGDANATIDSMQRNIQMKVSKIASGVREAIELFKAVVNPDTNLTISDLAD
mmetsp:Transcript_12541/g.24469  ORF Transcript_12541/g.24469 Transcript_12541/m.24469 type:complete len:323 (-) Transcript_12541:48-1016(-)